MVKRAAPFVLVLALGACGTAEPAATGEDGRFAGLDGEIRVWRETVMKTRDVCAAAPEGKACQSFEIACKGELPIAPADAARGVTAKIVAAMTYDGWDPGRAEFTPGSAFAQFAKAGGTWTRSEAAPVNLSTCAAS